MKCKKCGGEIVGVPAISRYDNKTPICNYCGTREALEVIGKSNDEINKVIDAIKKYN